ncbi:hypothetical protein J437_LFUL001700 [Ladona fulva]|uniref:Nucleoporin NUP42 n=1 Tax=Ladona fulva TaxID=123851 RepID=A0A8K0K3J8_LADFU|nr:hypothetical protein J437_LFUL001700 [Ladona fulva]
MVVCKFYVQGICRYGENCRFEHPGSQQQAVNYRNQNRSWQSPAYAASQGGRGTFQPDPRDLAAVIKEDVIAMEEGGQWPLSCYTPLKECPNFPNFYDTSMEEVRYEAYQAQASNTFDEYVKKIGDLIQETRLKWNLLKNPTPQIYSVIEKLASGKTVGENTAGPSSSFTFKTFSFNSPPSPTASSTFSLGTNPAFVSSNPQQQQQPPPGTFFSTSQPSSAASSFSFALPQQSQNVGSTFSASPPSFPQSQPVFGGSPSGFGQSGGLLFANNMTSPAAVSAALPQQPTSAGFFGSQPETNTQQSIFGMSQTPISQASSFGTTANVSTFEQKVPQPVVPDISVYTPVADLSEAEKKEYSAVTFTLSSIPLRPPARELCM